MKIKDLEFGEAFNYKEDAYIKIQPVDGLGCNAVKLDDGLLVKISNKADVQPYNN